ncbi:hypothetical protein PTSG_00803 [Salpingoeca rosetta]|uniref:EF-hand domain-containing protein n=1 Tax=Salpingoeca rosetta (strain ATCC 50818 / BSB-021) TaxID=946362 RepID=F2TXI8_SALR5|nr:uncharacterized protein PTSG_00803 [Salpingoeca rosetta]EGD76097.1 hypothetical protein PTSG_00803 [Salpingoeca rosetta]|eukprot:XP_004998272.1 hypothetical protein PTSG_00803 [Salpingoeca rosetta]
MSDPLDAIDSMPSPAAEVTALKQRMAVMERELSLRDERIKSLESDLRVAQYTIRQMEEEAASNLKAALEVTKEKKEKEKKSGAKKKGKAKRRRKKGDRSSTGSTAQHGQDGDQQEGEEITYDMIAQHYPDMKLSTVLRAERVFQQADIDGNGLIDVTELDKWLTKQDLIFSVNQVTALLLDMDINKDDSIDFLEYVGLINDLEDPERFKAKQQKLAPTTSVALNSIRTTLRGDRASTEEQSSSVCSLQ